MIVFDEASPYRHVKLFSRIITKPGRTSRWPKTPRKRDLCTHRTLDLWSPLPMSAVSTIDTNAGLPENLAYGRCNAARFLTRSSLAVTGGSASVSARSLPLWRLIYFQAVPRVTFEKLADFSFSVG